MSNIFQFGPEGRHISTDASGRLIANSSASDAPFVYAFGPEGHPITVDASGRLLITDVSASSGGGGGSGASNLNELSDVIITTPSSGQFLQYDGVFWENIDLNLETLNNVSGSAVSGQFLNFNGTNWIPSDVIQSLDDLSNVIEGTPSETDALVYSGGTWVPSGLSPLINSLINVDSVNGKTGVVVLDLNDINDVSTSGVSETDVLVYNSGTWVPSGLSSAISSIVTYETLLSNGDVGDASGQLASGNHAHEFNDLTDVVITSPASGQSIFFDGTNWANSTPDSVITSLSGLSDTDVSGVNETDALVYSGSTWIPSGLNPKIDSRVTYEILDSNGDIGSGSGQVASGGHKHTEADITDLQPYLLNINSESISDLSDVDITSSASGEILQYSGSTLVNRTPSEAGLSEVGHTHTESDITDLQAYLLNITGENIGDLANVSVSGQTETDVLALSGTTWVPSGISYPVTSVNGETGAVSLEINDITDVDVTSVASGEVLKWDGSNWINNTLAEAGVSVVGHTHVEADITDLQAYLLNITGESIGDLSNVDVTGQSETDVLALSGTTWIPSGISFPVTSVNGETGDVDLEIGDISNVTITSAANGEVLQYSGTTLVNRTLSEAGISEVGHTHTESDITDLQAYLLNITGENIGDLSDVNASGASNGESLVYSGGTWVPSGVTGGSASLSGLSDTSISSPSSGQLLRYNGTNWENYDNVPFRDKVITIGTDFNAVVNTVYLFQASSGQLTGTLPASHSEGDRVVFKDMEGSGHIERFTIDTADSDTIDGASTEVISSPYASRTVISDGSNWHII